jgi:hypothetical protein
MGNVWTARARLVAVISELFILRQQKRFLLQYCPVCRRKIVAAVRDRVPRDVQHCGVMLVFVYDTDYTEHILVWEASSFPASQESPAFYASREFITVFTIASHFSVIRVGRIQSALSHPCMHFSPIRSTCPAYLILVLIISTNRAAPHCAVSLSLLLQSSVMVQIAPDPRMLERPQTVFFPWRRDRPSHRHKQYQNYSCAYFNRYVVK